MISENGRFCDVCEEEIPKETKYRKVSMKPEAAALLGAFGDPELIPTSTKNQDGTVSMDICLTCSMSMGGAPSEERLN